MNLKITEGISDYQIKELINYSNSDKLIKETTHDQIRFKNLSSFNKWLLKTRTIYVLTDKKEKLYGIIWLGVEKLPKDKKFIKKINLDYFSITFAIRIYDKARGTGNSKPFMETVFEKYKKTKDYKENKSKGIWLETNVKNIKAVKAYLGFGFKKASKEDDEKRIIMILG